MWNWQVKIVGLGPKYALKECEAKKNFHQETQINLHSKEDSFNFAQEIQTQRKH
jgi:hypothetical protein